MGWRTSTSASPPQKGRDASSDNFISSSPCWRVSATGAKPGRQIPYQRKDGECRNRSSAGGGGGFDRQSRATGCRPAKNAHERRWEFLLCGPGAREVSAGGARKRFQPAKLRTARDLLECRGGGVGPDL